MENIKNSHKTHDTRIFTQTNQYMTTEMHVSAIDPHLTRPVWEHVQKLKMLGKST